MGILDKFKNKKRTLVDLNIEQQYPKINETADIFLENFGPEFTKTPNGHIATDIAGASSLAGLVLLRSTGLDLSKYKPGTVILGEDINELLDELFKFMANVAYSLGLKHETGWNDNIPAEHEPLYDTLQLTQKLEKSLYAACSKTGIQQDYYSFVSALTAMKLVAAGDQMKILSANIGKSIAMYHVIAGSKTVPNFIS